MKLITHVHEARSLADEARASGRTIALVPTMGALHEGHLELVRAARETADLVWVSVFVNRMQFGPAEDYDAYPRILEKDSSRLTKQGIASAMFAPSEDEMYADSSPLTWITVDQLGEHLCGASRPGHFRGVTTIVAKLLNICRPDVAVFGLKDVQQFYIISRMVKDLDMDVQLVGVPTVRESDGLALSSRNKYLSPEERGQAAALYRAVSGARRLIEEGETDGDLIRHAMRRDLDKAGSGRIDYAEVVNATDFKPLDLIPDSSTVVAAAAVYFGRARLIDNAIIQVPARESGSESATMTR